MNDWLYWLSNVLPLSYAVDALTEAQQSTTLTAGMIADLAIVAGCSLAALAFGAATLRRQTP
jgi:ABC-2 type transport system permease protein